MSESERVPEDVEPTPDTRALDLGALKALAHPIRVRIFDILSQRGPQTASSLAAYLGESSGSTSYHLRALARQNLVREVADRGTARERWWERPAGRVQVGAPEVTRTPSGKAAAQVVSEEMYRGRHEQLLQFLRSGSHEDTASAELTTAAARLSQAQFEELRGELAEVITRRLAEYRAHPAEGARPYLVRLDLFPLDTADNTDNRKDES